MGKLKKDKIKATVRKGKREGGGGGKRWRNAMNKADSGVY